MIKLGQHIQYLLTQHDCVIVPGWGAFIVQLSAARLDDNDTLFPPQKAITFNPAVTHNDGLLAGSLMRRHGLSFELACQKIEDEIDTMKHVIAANGEVAIEGIGLFKAISGGTPRFEQSRESIHTVKYEYLPTLSVKPVKLQALTDAGITPENNQILSPVTRFRNTALKAVASIALLICAVSALMMPIGPENKSLVSMASIGSNIFERQQAIDNDDTDINLPDGRLYISMPHIDNPSVIDTTFRSQYRAIVRYKAMVAERKEARRKAREERIAKINQENTPRPEQQAIPAASLTINESDPYCLVVSSHTSRAQAEKYIASHPSQPMRILEMDGKYRVYIATGTTSARVRSAINNTTIRKQYPGAWVCSK